MTNDKLGAWLKKTVMPVIAPKKSAAPLEKAPIFKTPTGAPAANAVKPAISPQKPFKKPYFPPRGQNSNRGKLRIIPLGGLEEVGKNMMVMEYVPQGQSEASDIIIIDTGFQFPEEDMLGIDYVIPDINYLSGKTHKIRGIFLTHGHLDHIGGLPYLYEKLGMPVLYGTKLTLGLVRKKFEEFCLDRKARYQAVDFPSRINLGSFQVEFFRVNHSFPDSAGLIVRTPAGTVVHTGDFKFDFTPADKKPADFARIASLANEHVIALLTDSTNATKPGYTMSEKQVGETLYDIIKNIPGRVAITLFASSIGRLQQIVDAAIHLGRTVYLSGRSIVDNAAIARELGYIKAPAGKLIDIKRASPKEIESPRALILTTGSQGESLSALARMAMGDHAHVRLKKGDTVIFSSSPIIGNERAITTVVNNLCQMGVSAISNQAMDVHASGHAQQEDLKLMMNLVRPKYVVPIHGEFYMRTAHAKLAMGLGYDEAHVITAANGNILEISDGKLCMLNEKVDTNYIMVDGLGVGNMSSQVLMERQIMASNGVLIILLYIHKQSRKLTAQPEAISRGFIYLKESQELIREVIEEAKKAYADIITKDKQAPRGDIKNYIRGRLDRFVHKKIEKSPLVLPVLIECA